jgi:hypothetical protein
MSEEYDTNEYLITNEKRVFAGNALELMTVMYKAEQLPVRVRLYAASKAIEFECDKSGRTLEEIREEVRRELIEANNDDGWKEKLEADVKRIRARLDKHRLTPLIVFDYCRRLCHINSAWQEAVTEKGRAGRLGLAMRRRGRARGWTD